MIFALSVIFASCEKNEPVKGEDCFTATIFTGMHMASLSSNLDSYIVSFSDGELDKDGNVISATVHYTLALTNVLGRVDAEGYVTVPSGTYTLSDNNITGSWTNADSNVF